MMDSKVQYLTEIFINTNQNYISLIKRIDEGLQSNTADSSNGIKDKQQTKFHGIETVIAQGTIQVIQRLTIKNYSETKQEVHFAVTRANADSPQPNIIKESPDIFDLTPSKFTKFLIKHGIKITDNKNVTVLQNFLLGEYSNMKETTECPTAQFGKDGYQTYKPNNYIGEYVKPLDFNGILKLDYSSDGLTKSYTIKTIILCLIGIAELLPLMPKSVIPPLAAISFISYNTDNDIETIKKVFCVKTSPYLKRGFSKELDKSIIVPLKASQHQLTAAVLSEISELLETENSDNYNRRIVVLLTDDTATLSSNNEFLCLQRFDSEDYNLSDMTEVAEWFRAALSKSDDDAVAIENKIKTNCNHISSEYGISGKVCNLCATMAYMFDNLLFYHHFDDSRRQLMINSFLDNIIDLTENYSVINAVVEELASESNIAIYSKDYSEKLDENLPAMFMDTDNAKLMMNRKTFAQLSKRCGYSKPIALSDSLKAAGCLESSKQNQRKPFITAYAGQRYMYTLLLNKMYSFSNLLPDFKQNESEGDFEHKLYIGNSLNATDKKIYLCLNRTKDNTNNHILVLGNTTKGKSTFLRHYATQSAASGFQTLIIDRNGKFAQEMSSSTVSNKTLGEDYMVLSELTKDNLEQLIRIKQPHLTKDEISDIEKTAEKCRNSSSILANAEFSPSVHNYLSVVMADKLIIGKPLKWEEILLKGRITILDMSKLKIESESVFKTISNIILTSFFNYCVNNTPDTICTLIIDEAHNFGLKNSDVLYRRIMREGRNYGISAVLATQKLDTLDNA